MEITAETLENLDELSPEDKEKLAVTVSEQYKQLQSSTTKGIQQMNEAIKFYKSSNGDMDKIAELSTENPEIAKIVLDKFYDGKTLEELMPAKPEVLDDVDTKVKAALESQKVADTLAATVAQLPEDIRSKFQEEFDEITEGKTLTSQTISKYISLTIKSISPEVDSAIEQQAKLAIGNVTGDKKPAAKPNNHELIKQQSRDLLKAQGIN